MKHAYIILALLFLTSVLAAQTATVNEGQWQWMVVEDFEIGYNWPVVNHATYEDVWVRNFPRLSLTRGASKNLQAEKKENCLGAKLRIDRDGDTREFIVPRFPVKLSGITQKITFWVHSRNAPLTLKVMFKDHMSVIRTLQPVEFTLDFYGWKKFEINDIDKKIINQKSSAAPDYKPLEIIAFVVENPQHNFFYKPVYIYLDQLEAYSRADELTDYDGNDMRSRW